MSGLRRFYFAGQRRRTVPARRHTPDPLCQLAAAGNTGSGGNRRGWTGLALQVLEAKQHMYVEQ
jgi:hypothetical protein